MRNWICRFGEPDSILGDQGSNFESKVFEEICRTLEIRRTRSTTYHPEGNGQVENIQKTLKAMLKARIEENPKSWDEHLDYCMMAYRSSVHVSTGHPPFELMFGREIRIPLDAMMGSADSTGHSYTEFVADLRENLETAYQDVRQNLKMAQRRQKDAYDKGVKHYQAGDFVLRFSPELKPGEASKFQRQWEGPYKIVKQVTEVNYLVEKVGGRSGKSKVVHFNNLRLYKKRQEGSTEETGARGAVDAQQGGNGAGEQVQTTLEGVASMEPDTVTSGTEEEVVWSVARSEGYNQVVDRPDERASGDPSYIADSASGREIEQGAESDRESASRDPFYITDSTSDSEIEQDAGSDHVVDIPAAENAQGCSMSGGEDREDEDEVEEEQLIGQGQRPARIRRPPDRYGEWILNSLQQITDRLKMLEDKQRQNKKPIKKPKPKLLKKARTLREL